MTYHSIGIPKKLGMKRNAADWRIALRRMEWGPNTHSRDIHAGELGHYALGMSVRYNGGTVIDGEWWQGEEWQLPLLAEGYEIVHVPTWGYRIIKTPEKSCDSISPETLPLEQGT